MNQPDINSLANAFNKALGVCMDLGTTQLQKLMALHDAVEVIRKTARAIKEQE